MAALELQLRSNLPHILARLSEVESKVLAQAVHQGGKIDRGRFAAIYGVGMPDLTPWAHHRRSVSLLLLLGLGGEGRFVVFDSLLEPLKRLIPEPVKPAVVTTAAIPETYSPPKKGWRQATPRPVRIHESSEIAPLELRSVLQFVRQGRFSVAGKSLRPTESSSRSIAQILVTPDFDAEFSQAASASRRTEAVGSFRAHAWGAVIQQCGWASRSPPASWVPRSAGLEVIRCAEERFRGRGRLSESLRTHTVNHSPQHRADSAPAARSS